MFCIFIQTCFLISAATPNNKTYGNRLFHKVTAANQLWLHFLAAFNNKKSYLSLLWLAYLGLKLSGTGENRTTKQSSTTSIESPGFILFRNKHRVFFLQQTLWLGSHTTGTLSGKIFGRMDSNSVSPMPPPEAPLAMMEVNEKSLPRTPSCHDMPPPPDEKWV